MSSSKGGSGQWLGIGLAVVASALTFGAGAFLAGASVIVGMGVGAGLGAAVGALGLLANQSGSGKNSRRQSEDIVFTTTTRNQVVPVLFGRARVAGNYIAIGKFFETKDAKDETPGRRIHLLNAVIALCEGPIKKVGNPIVNGQPPSRLAAAENLTTLNYQLRPILGYADDTIPCIRQINTNCSGGKPGFIDDPEYGFPGSIKVPWRNTAKLLVNCVCGDAPALIDVNVDAIGMDKAIRRSRTWSETDPGDHAIRAGYDGYTEQYYYCMTASTATTAPFGLVTVGRQDGDRVHTPPPASVSTSVTMAWYLGKHDILVMQDPSDSTKFHIGYPGIARDSADWETFQPDPDGGYANAIVGHYLDEYNGVLHTLHWDPSGTRYYVMRWSLLSGRVTHLKTELTSQSVNQFMYSPDFDAYVLAHSSGNLHLLAADTGFIYRTSPTDASISRARGVFVSGQLIGYCFDSNVNYWDPYEQTITSAVEPGTYAGVTTRDNFTNAESFPVVQNSWTGHVTITRNSPSLTLINFIPSIKEAINDYSAMGTPKPDDPADAKADDWKEFTPTPITAQYISRDWSWRQWGNYSLTALEGTSGVAGALWSVMVSEPNLDSARWGAGLDPSYFSLASFESLHSYCVGAVRRSDDETPLVVSSITRSGSVATATSDGHGYYDGDTVTITGAAQGAYNGTFKINTVTANTFKYTLTGTPATPATTTSTIKVSRVGWYAERYKFDFLLDTETNLSSFVAGELLTAVNGFRTVVGGKLYVGINRKGVFPTWHFTEENFADATPKLAFAGRGDNPNRIRVMFTNVKDEYRKDWAEANNELEQSALGRVQSRSLTVNGIARFTHADLLAQAVLDGAQSARRQFEFKTHYLGLVITAGDAIEVSHQATGLDHVVFRVGQLEEDDDGSITVTAQEQVRARDTIRSDPPKKLQVTGPSEVNNPCPCFRVTPVIGSNMPTWFNSGAAFQPGTYRIRYVGGAYKDSRTGSYGMDYYSIFTMTSGIALKLADAPKSGVENIDVGVLIAYALSTVQTITITINEPTSIGALAPSWAQHNDGGQGGDAMFELCPPSNCDGENPIPDPIVESDNGGEYYGGGAAQPTALTVDYSGFPGWTDLSGDGMNPLVQVTSTSYVSEGGADASVSVIEVSEGVWELKLYNGLDGFDVRYRCSTPAGVYSLSSVADPGSGETYPSTISVTGNTSDGSVGGILL